MRFVRNPDMRFVRNPKLIMGPADQERRQHGRLRCEHTKCCLGEVVDLSASGMRVQNRGRVLIEDGQGLRITISHHSSGPDVSILARVVRIERTGFRRHLIGFHFEQLTDEQKRQMAVLARTATEQLVFRCLPD